MRGSGPALFIMIMVASASPGLAQASQWTSWQVGRALFEGAFNPDRLFDRELRPGSTDAVVLTVSASNRDDYAPAYSLAVAYMCEATRCRFVARTLRVGPPGHGQAARSFALLRRIGAAGQDRIGQVLASSSLEWLEADLDRCENSIHALDSIRVADWRPDQHPALSAAGSEVILHPAMIRVRMSGNRTTSRYEGWVLADGVPRVVRRLVDVLEPCWRPSSAPAPWTR